jgi:superfamily I DNA/RNA helicase
MDPSAAIPETSLIGEDGEVEVLHVHDQDEEACRIVAWIQTLISNGVPESEIAILYDKQPDQYAVPLLRTLDGAGIRYRNEQTLQDLVAQPLTSLLLSYLQLLAEDRNPAAYVRLKRSQLFHIDSETALSRLRVKWEAFLKAAQALVTSSFLELSDRQMLQQLTRGFLDFFGDSAIAALHPDYESKTRVEELVEQIIERVLELVARGSTTVEAFRRFVDEPGVRVMSIHKSKGLEFTAVAIPAVEQEMFWAKPDDERAAFFVAVSRAKKYLLLSYVTTRTRPPGVSYWTPTRTPHQEFLSYADNL